MAPSRCGKPGLTAPQYPQGLSLTASATGVTGDIDEVNDLNHYVGMRAFETSDAPEMALWAPTIVLALRRRGARGRAPSHHPVGRLAKVALWAIPVGALLDVQYRLYQYGHGVQDDAPIRLEPFTPLVVGPTKVLNFTTWAYPGLAIWCLLGAALPRDVRTRTRSSDSGPVAAPARLRLRRGVRGPRAGRSGMRPARILAVALLLLLTTSALPASAQETGTTPSTIRAITS